ncbi:MAG: radical SAM protein [Candidatus Pacebacteria bacterium]|nr:radical SAM protein [Candidatus Paceibacterota bacterium]
MPKISEIKASSIITKSNLPKTDYVINPYVGCMHHCFYCYARFMKRFTEHEEGWGEFVDVKINASELVPKKSEKYKGKTILLSSVTDAYQPIERKYEITRKILEKLIPLETDLEILTKSDLVLRDIDLIKKFKSCRVGITIATLDEDLRRKIEPFASPVQNRIRALEKLKENEIETYVFLGPILPCLTDWKKIILSTRHATDYYMFENLNASRSLWLPIKIWLKDHRPNLLKEYEKIYFTPNDYWKNTEKEIADFCKTERVKYEIFFHHGK